MGVEMEDGLGSMLSTAMVSATQMGRQRHEGMQPTEKRDRRQEMLEVKELSQFIVMNDPSHFKMLQTPSYSQGGTRGRFLRPSL